MRPPAPHGGFTVWLTGLSGAGKTTLARALHDELAARGRRSEILDGDEVRRDLSAGLGFSRADRDANIRRIGYVARLLSRNGVATLVAAISPYRLARDSVREAIESDGGVFLEVYVSCPLEVLVSRDPKGLYRRALAGELSHFTGVDDPFEEPLRPELILPTAEIDVAEGSARLLALLASRSLFPQTPAPGADASAHPGGLPTR